MNRTDEATGTRFPEYEGQRFLDREGRPMYGNAMKYLCEFDNAFDVPCVLSFSDGYLDGDSAIQTPTGWMETWVKGRFVSGAATRKPDPAASDFERRERALDCIRRAFADETFIFPDGTDPRFIVDMPDIEVDFLALRGKATPKGKTASGEKPTSPGSTQGEKKKK